MPQLTSWTARLALALADDEVQAFTKLDLADQALSEFENFCRAQKIQTDLNEAHTQLRLARLYFARALQLPAGASRTFCFWAAEQHAGGSLVWLERIAQHFRPTFCL